MQVANLRFGSLFAGIGGFDLGLERAGMECAWQVEIDPWCQKVLKKHWPAVPLHDDVKTFPPGNSKDWEVDLICAGFPCTDISTSGRGEGIHGKRSGLFTEVIRCTRVFRPRYVLLENVPAITFRGLGVVVGELAQAGYDCQWACLPAAEFGAPHLRKRIFILGELQRTATRTEDGWWCLRCGTDIFSGCGCYHGEWICKQCESWTYPFYYEFKEGCQTCGSDDVAHPPRTRGEVGVSEATSGEEGNPAVVFDGSHLSRRGTGSNFWSPGHPGIHRMGHGIPKRMDRLRGLGNAVLPQVSEFIGRQLIKAHSSPADES
mgnify:CR=1 FL=1